MTKLVPLKCTVCGANLPQDTLICKYCGTHFVLSAERVAVAVKAAEKDETERAIEEAKETYIEGETFIQPKIPPSYSPNDFMLDDRVDRKILKYLNETRKSKYDAVMEKYKECKKEIYELRRLLKSNQIDEDSCEDRCKELWRKYEIAKEQIDKMLDCGEALKTFLNFIIKGIEDKTNNFHGIKSIGNMVFDSVDGRVSESSFAYKITGCVECHMKLGILTTKLVKRYFSSEVDYKTGEVIQFSWQHEELLNVQEYRARPLALPKFTQPQPKTSS